MFNFPDFTHPLADCDNDVTFESRLSALIARQLTETPKLRFGDLIRGLPSVYPAVVLKQIAALAPRIATAAKIVANVTDGGKGCLVKKNQRDPSRLLPHPLDYEWRFTQGTLLRLGKNIKHWLASGSSFVGLGTPSLIAAKLNRRMILLDSNPALGKLHSELCLSGDLVHCDIVRDPLPHLLVDLVVLDPPWYLSEMLGFVWAARCFCRIGGRALLVVPQVGTRPGIKHDLEQLRAWIEHLNFRVDDFARDVVRYDSPFFERQALDQEGVRRYPLDWRRADLLTLRAQTPVRQVVRPQQALAPRWQEVCFSEDRIRIVASDSRAFKDPGLISLVEGDCPVGVSRRDVRKRNAKVWTSGNRIFDCLGPGIFFTIAKALAGGKKPINAVRAYIERSLIQTERDQTARAIRQLRCLLRIEMASRSNWGKDVSKKAEHPKAAALGSSLPGVLRRLGVESSRYSAIHLAVFVEPYLEYVLDGSKTVESRFSKARRAPYKQVDVGDLVLMKKSGGAIVGAFEVAQVWSYVLDTNSWGEVRSNFTQALRAQDPTFWRTRAGAQYATLMRVCNVRRFEPCNIPKRDMRGWVVLKGRMEALNLGL